MTQIPYTYLPANPEFKTCPTCAHNNMSVEWENDAAFVLCHWCGARGPFMQLRVKDSPFTITPELREAAAKKAADAWNWRPLENESARARIIEDFVDAVEVRSDEIVNKTGVDENSHLYAMHQIAAEMGVRKWQVVIRPNE